MREAALENTPEFYKSPADNPYTERLHRGAMFGYTALTIVERILEKKTLSFKGEILSFRHKQKRRCEPFVRYREVGATVWQTAPTTNQLGGTFGSTRYVLIDDINEQTIDIEFFDLFGGIELEFEILLIDFSI